MIRLRELDPVVLRVVDLLPLEISQGRGTCSARISCTNNAHYREFLPSSVLDRKKHGFGAPVDVWLKGPLKKIVAELGQVPLFAAAPVGKMNAQKRWALAVFSQWARQWNASW